MTTEVSDSELPRVIKDFLEMGHVDNIAAVFQRQACPFDWAGAILDDERFTVRLGNPFPGPATGIRTRSYPRRYHQRSRHHRHA